MSEVQAVAEGVETRDDHALSPLRVELTGLRLRRRACKELQDSVMSYLSRYPAMNGCRIFLHQFLARRPILSANFTFHALHFESALSISHYYYDFISGALIAFMTH